jgi:glucosamine-phosphate N-acetyltransferase
MSEIKYISLIHLINTYPKEIEKIKEKYLQLLSELTAVNNLDTTLFIKNVEMIDKMGKIVIGIIENDNNFEIIASGTIIIEPKIIRNGKNVGHVEDIVVSKDMRGKGISQKILHILKTIAKNNDCYKIILDCTEDVKNVYIKNGFQVKGIQMSEYFL